MDLLDGASGLMELFRGKISAEERTPTPTTPSPPTCTTPSALPPKKRRLDSIPSSTSASQPKARPSSTSNGPVENVSNLANISSTTVANTLAVDLSLVPSLGGWPFAMQPLQNTYVSPMVFMRAATEASTPNKRKKLYDSNMPQFVKTPAPAAARPPPIAAATPLAQLDYQQHFLAQNLAQSGMAYGRHMAYGTIFSPQCKTPSQAWQQQAQQQAQQQQWQALPVPRAPAVQQRPRGAYPAAGQNCQLAARWQASLHALLSRGDLAENNHRLLDPISKCDVWEVPSKVLRLPPRQVDVLHPEVRSLVVQFQRDLASTKPAAVYKAQLHARTMQAPCVLNSVQVLAGHQGRAY